MSVDKMNELTVPLAIISTQTREIISVKLNPRKFLTTDDGVLRDWRGLVHLLDFSGDVMALIISQINPTIYILTILEQKQKNFTIKDFLMLMEQMDRWDIIDDTKDLLEKDVIRYLEEKKRAEESADVIEQNADHEILTTGDIHRLQQGLEKQRYDAFLLYADEDIDFANEMIQKLETEYKLKLCLKDRDLVSASFEHEAVMKLIYDRCNRLLIIISPNFLESMANNFFLNFAQALSIEKRQRKIIPCLYKKCELPIQLKYMFILDYNRKGAYDFWDRLYESVRVVPNIRIQKIVKTNILPNNDHESVRVVQNTRIQEVVKATNTLPDNHNHDISQTCQVTEEDISKCPQQNIKNIVIEEINNTKASNPTDKKSKTLLRWVKSTTTRKKKQTKQSDQTVTETVLKFSSLKNLDSLNSLDLSSTDIYEKKKKKKPFMKLKTKVQKNMEKIPIEA